GCATVPPRTASGTRCRTGGGRDRHTGVRVRPVRGRRARYPGTRRTARTPRRRRPVPVRAQPHIPRARRHDPRPGDSAVAARPVVVHGVRRARAGRLGLPVGAAGAAGPVRRAVRRIPAGGTGLVATSPTLAAPIDHRRPRPTPDHDLQLPCQSPQNAEYAPWRLAAWTLKGLRISTGSGAPFA